MNSWNILITGGSRGIGNELVEQLSKQGHSIVTSSRDPIIVETLNQLPNVVAYQLDLTNTDSIDDFVNFVKTQEKKLDVLINNAGISLMGSVEFISDADRSKMFQTNVSGPINLTRKLIPMLAESKGKIVFISSDEGLITLPYSTDYGATKHAIDAYAEGLNYELKKLQIDVISINPGVIKTDLIYSIINEIDSRQIETFDANIKARFETEKQKLIEDISSEKNLIQPKEIGKKIIDILNSDKYLPQYALTSPSETDYLISSLIDKITLLNATSEFGFNLDELQDKLKFSYEVLDQD